MTGTAYLGGGGDAHDEAALWELALADRPRVLYWPFALAAGRLASAEEWFTTSVATHQAGLDIETWTSLEGRSGDELEAFGLVFIGGGNTFDLLAHLREHDALTWLRDHLARGGDLYGGSAGAVVAAATAAIAEGHDPNTTSLTSSADLTGLGLLGSLVLRPHHTPDLCEEVQRWSTRHGSEVVGVPERAGLVVVGDQATVVGSAPVWRLTASSAVPVPPGRSFTTDRSSSAPRPAPRPS